jgi:type 1 glutamine amidotransferase
MFLSAIVGALAVVGGIQTPTSVTYPARSILVFSKSSGFRHDSIPIGREAILHIAMDRGWTVSFTEDSGQFNPRNLRAYDAIVFLSTTGKPLDEAQGKALVGFIHAGGGYVGIHAAADALYDWPWYGRLVGAFFMHHPAQQEAMVKIEDQSHPSMTFLPNPWRRFDEWYDYKTDPRANVHVLASLDQSSYTGSTMGPDHPITWCQNFEGGRSWYTGMGHTQDSYRDPLFLKMLAEGIEWSCEKSQRH